ncbi:MAG: hypothetical protein WA060_00770 [Minisyncoccia bacterium]
MSKKGERRRRIREERRHQADDRFYLLEWLSKNRQTVSFFVREAKFWATEKEVAQ